MWGSKNRLLAAPPPLMARKGVATPSAAALLLRVTPSARCLLQDDRTQPSLRPPVPCLLPDLAPNYPSPKFPPGTLTCFSVYFNLPRPTTALWLALPVYTWSPTFLGTPTYTTVYFNFPLPALWPAVTIFIGPVTSPTLSPPCCRWDCVPEPLLPTLLALGSPGWSNLVAGFSPLAPRRPKLLERSFSRRLPTCRWSLFLFFSHALFRSLALVFLNTLPPLLPTPSSSYAPTLITEMFFHTSSVTWSLSGRSCQRLPRLGLPSSYSPFSRSRLPRSSLPPLPPLPVWSLLLSPHYPPARTLVSFSRTTFTAARSPHGSPWAGLPSGLHPSPISSPLPLSRLPLFRSLTTSRSLRIFPRLRPEPSARSPSISYSLYILKGI